MNKSSLQSVLGQLEELFRLFNERFYNNQLQTPVISVSPDVTVGAYGWCTSWRAWQREGTDGFYEINLCAEHLNRPFHETCVTLLHEMVHLWNLQNDIKDTSRGGMYHNKKFKTEAEQRGLSIQQHEKYGWTISELSAEGIEFIDSIENQVFELYRTPITKSDKAKATRKKSSSRKYICPNCQQSIRATKELKVLCGECSTEDNLVIMECEEAEGEDE